MREVLLDTETTGLDPLAGHRIIEIAALELENHLPTGRNFHRFLKPDCDISPEAQAIHGIKREDLADKPEFGEIVSDLLEFLGDARLVIHNADFDLAFLNREFAALGFPAYPRTRAIDTVQMARRKFPGAPASLDALCQRFNIDNSRRTLHGALLDCELLADVYLELLGGRQAAMLLDSDGAGPRPDGAPIAPPAVRPGRVAVILAPTEEELAAHAALLAKLKGPIWTAAS